MLFHARYSIYVAFYHSPSIPSKSFYDLCHFPFGSRLDSFSCNWLLRNVHDAHSLLGDDRLTSIFNGRKKSPWIPFQNIVSVLIIEYSHKVQCEFRYCSFLEMASYDLLLRRFGIALCYPIIVIKILHWKAKPLIKIHYSISGRTLPPQESSWKRAVGCIILYSQSFAGLRLARKRSAFGSRTTLESAGDADCSMRFIRVLPYSVRIFSRIHKCVPQYIFVWIQHVVLIIYLQKYLSWRSGSIF